MSRSQKNPQESSVEMRELVLPNDTNSHGNVLGGKVLHLMDYIMFILAIWQEIVLKIKIGKL